MNTLFLGLLFSQITEPPIISRQVDVSRETPIVKAIKKAEKSIVIIKNGTGIIVSENGYILTTAHLAVLTERPTITMSNGDKVLGKIHHIDYALDLAIIKIQAKKLQAIQPFTENLILGETVIAIGNPHGFTNTVTNGIISAIDREIRMPNGNKSVGLIQTNAAINPGNSGGPLLNINGELIGLTVALHEGSQGIAFAINAKVIKKYLDKVLK